MKALSLSLFIFLIVFGFKSFAQLNEPRCIIAYYPFEGNTLDSSGHANHAINHGASSTWGHLGNNNSAYELSGNVGMNGSDIFIEVPNIVDSLYNLTISLWVKHNSYSYYQYGETYISFGTLPAMGTVSTSIYYDKNYNVIRYVLMTDIGTYSCSTPYMSSWIGAFQHFALVYDGSNGVLKGYHNGAEVASHNGAVGKVKALGSYGGIGKHWWANGVGNSTRINGVFDEVKIYKCALDSITIEELYTSMPAYISTRDAINVYPIPSKEIVNFEFDNRNSEEHSLSVYNALGQEVRKIGGVTSSKMKIEKASLLSGLYFYRLRNDHSTISTGVFIFE
ncbi:MAG: T9SS type A sorting domain-containing protein [Bacteroidales bacterium]|nr:T9SS type A sorting domain-containing protein [Bacteroidales bacterium]